MALFKCKMCGGSLEIAAGTTVIECEYCGTLQTLPKLDDDRRANMYDRANHFRRNNEFDKAMGIYEQLLNEDNTDAETYWSIVLCRYGIEYVEDVKTQRRIPTVNRAQLIPVSADSDYALALQYADFSQRIIYEKEAKAIDEILEGIYEFSRQEEAFDVFISYKETDDTTGIRTQDSLDALEVFYLPLIKKGYNVFYAPVTLKEKHIPKGKYDSYIFSALSSAKVMIVLGSKEEYFQSEWVKNEWGRYLNRIVKNNEDKDIIPIYRNISPGQLPEKLRSFEAFDLSKPDTLFYVMQKIEQAIPKKTADTFSNQEGSPTTSNIQQYNVILTSFGSQKLLCIKLVRELLGLGLKEATDLVQSCPAILASDISLNEAEKIKNRFSRNGFGIEVKESGSVARPRANTVSNSSGTETLLKRVSLFLEAGDWNNADSYCEKVLDIDPENTQAYIYKLLATLKATKEEYLIYCDVPLDNMMAYKNALRFADEDTAQRLIEYNRVAKEKIAKREKERQERAQKEEAERQEQARIESERRQQEEKKRQEIHALQSARDNATKLISAQIREQENLKGLIAKKQSDAKTAVSSKKLMTLSLLVVIFGAAAFISVFAYAAGAGDICDLLYFVSILSCMMFSVPLLKADGKSGWLFIINPFTFGIFGIVIAIIVLKKIKNNKTPQYALAQEISALKAQLQQVEAQIDATRHSLREINQKLAIYE